MDCIVSKEWHLGINILCRICRTGTGAEVYCDINRTGTGAVVDCIISVGLELGQ